jgi:hypothetical protein
MDFFQGKTERIVDGTRYVKYLDLNKWYCVLVPKNDNALNDMAGYDFWDEDKGDVRDDFFYMKFHEDTYLLMEDYLFNFIDDECHLLINMYEEEWIDGENLPKALEITNRMINNCDNEEFIKLATEFRGLIEKAIEYKTCVGCYF